MQLQNKVAVIVGGGRGIGRAIALAYAEHGATVVVAARSSDELAETVWLIDEIGNAPAHALTVDICDSQQIDHLVAETLRLVGTPHILVNSAGIGFKAPLLETSEDHWNRIHDTLLKGMYLTIRAFLPAFIEQKQGNIITIGAPLEKLAIPGFAAYSAAKYGVQGLTLALAKELRRHSINVNLLHPGGFADTRLMRETVPEVNKGLLSPDSITEAAVALATQPPRGRTGEIINSQQWQTSETTSNTAVRN